METTMLQIKDLKVSFHHQRTAVQVVRGVDLVLGKGEIVGLLGESGSGKTVTATSILRLYEKGESFVDGGEILFEGEDLLGLTERKMQKIRGKQIAYVFQNPTAALNPYKTIGRQLAALMKNHKLPHSPRRIVSALKEVGIDEPGKVYDMYPGQLSGGQNQRVMIAQAILCKPDLLIADEPTSAIDEALSQKILDLLAMLNQKYGMSILLITHDFDVARYLCQRLVILYGGLVVEEGSMDAIFHQPLHPYTEELLKCAISLEREDSAIHTLEGTPLTPGEFKEECPFHARCAVREAACLDGIPHMKTRGDRKVRCIRYDREARA